MACNTRFQSDCNVCVAKGFLFVDTIVTRSRRIVMRGNTGLNARDLCFLRTTVMLSTDWRAVFNIFSSGT